MDVILPAAVLMLAALDLGALEREFARLVKDFPGRVGVCAQTAEGRACLRAEELFSQQSVIKMDVAIAVMAEVDAGRMRLDDPIVVRREDLSVFVQPIKEKVGPKGFKTDVRTLIHSAVTQSDSAAVDVLIARLGGPAKVQEILNRLGVSGLRVDRDEKHLQSEIAGLTWRAEYVDEAVFEKARAAVPVRRQAASYRAYQVDPRDTATPKGMAEMLWRLAQGRLVSKESTRFLLETMGQTATGADRLKAGLAAGWRLAHKTGTSSAFQGVRAATNDVGVLTSPTGEAFALAVFVADSKATDEQNAALIAALSAALCRAQKTE